MLSRQHHSFIVPEYLNSSVLFFILTQDKLCFISYDHKISYCSKIHTLVTVIFVGILSTCGKHLHMTPSFHLEGVWGDHKSKKTLPATFLLKCLHQTRKVSMCVGGFDFASVSMFCWLDIGIIPAVFILNSIMLTFLWPSPILYECVWNYRQFVSLHNLRNIQQLRWSHGSSKLF